MKGIQTIFVGIFLMVMVLSCLQSYATDGSSAAVTVSTQDLGTELLSPKNEQIQTSPASTSLSVFGGLKTAFYGTANDDSIRNLTGYADYVVVSHALYNDGNTIKDNVQYLATHGVKVILDTAWWDVWPFDGAVNGYSELHVEDLAWGMNGTETVKYRIRNCIETIGSEYIWGVTIDEEVGDPSVDDFPWPFIAWYQNLFCDWMHAEYPSIQVLAWPAAPYPEFVSNHLYHIRADGIVYDNYDQNITRMGEIASFLRSSYPEGPLIFLVSAAETISPWYTCHPPTYLKRVIREVSKYVDVIGFWTMTENGLWGWEDDQNPGYQLSLRMCRQIHLNDWNTVYSNTEWFECGFGNDTVTDSLSNWNSTYWYEVSPDPSLEIQLSADRQIGDYSINLTSTDSGIHSYWWQFEPGHYRSYPEWTDAEPYGAYNLSAASRISFWLKGIGWNNHPEATVRIFLEKSNYPAPTGTFGNLTLPEMTPYLLDGAWHLVSIDLPLDLSAYCDWDGYASQIRVEVDYDHSIVSDTTSILIDGWLVDSFDTGVAKGLNDPSDFIAVDNGTLEVGGSAYFESMFPLTDNWYYQYSGSGSVLMCINGSWVAPPDEGMPCYWNVTGVRLFDGSFDWIKINALPPLVVIISPHDESLVRGTILVEVNATDASGIKRVEFAVDGTLLYTDSSYPYSWDWDTSAHPDGPYRLNVTAYANSDSVNFYHIQVNIDNTKPAIAFTSPLNESRVSDSVQVTAAASDPSGIVQVEFFIEGALYSTDFTSPYEYLWDTSMGSDGLKNVICLATDEAGNTETDNILITVDNSGPVISIHSLSVWGDSGQIGVNTSDPSGVNRVEFYLEGALQYTDYAYPYEWIWSGFLLPDGDYTMTVISFDTLNHSSSVYSGLEIDNTLPSLSVTWVPHETDLTGFVSFSAISTDTNGIACVEFYLDGVLQYTDLAAPFEWNWDTTLVLDGNHTLAVVAVDNNANSRAITVNLKVDNTEPSIFVNSPINQTVLSGPSAITVRVTVQDTTSIDKVLLSYFSGTSWISVEMIPSSSYFEVTTPVFLHNTEVLFRIFANDTLGNSDWSLTYTCNIEDLTPPSIDVDITPSTMIVGGIVQLNVSVSDSSSISMVIVSVDGSPIAWFSSGPYSLLLDTSAFVDGIHTLTAWANDTWDNSDYSEVQFETDNTAPVIIIGTPTNGTVYDAQARVCIEASISDVHDLSQVFVFYNTGSTWVSESMVLSGSLYIWNSSLFSSGTVLLFFVHANDTIGNGRSTLMYVCYVNDLSSPLIGVPELSPIAPTSFDTVIVSVVVSDLSGVSASILSYCIDSGPWFNVTMNLNTNYWASIPAMPTGTVISYKIYGNDTLNQWTSTPIYEYIVVPFDVLPPNILDSIWIPIVPDELDAIDVSVNASDPSGVLEMVLSYNDGLSWHNLSMSFSDGSYIVQISPQSYGTYVTMIVYACDSQGNWGITPIGSFSVVSGDLDGPDMVLLAWSPLAPTEEDCVEVYVELLDTNGVQKVILCYGHEAMFANVSMTFNGTGYIATIGTRPIGTQMSFTVYSCDTRGNWVIEEWILYEVQASDIAPPIITDIEWLPFEPLSNESFEVNAFVSDENIISQVLLGYFDGFVWRNITMMQISDNLNQFTTSVPAIGVAGTIQILIFAQDSKGNWGFTDIIYVEILQVPVITVPTTPTVPTSSTTISPPDPLVIGLMGAMIIGVPAGIVVGLVIPRLLKRNRGS